MHFWIFDESFPLLRENMFFFGVLSFATIDHFSQHKFPPSLAVFLQIRIMAWFFNQEGLWGNFCLPSSSL